MIENITYRTCVKLLRSRLVAIQKLKPPTMVKGCRSLVGMVNFLSLFFPELYELLKLIYDLTRKGRQFFGKKSNKMLLMWLQKPQILHLLHNKGRFYVYSDTSIFATGSALFQIQNGKPKLLAYASKRILEAAQNYSITELELCCLAINIVSFALLLKKVDFDAIVDH